MPDRPAYRERKKVFGAHERGRHSLPYVNDEIQGVGDSVICKEGPICVNRLLDHKT